MKTIQVLEMKPESNAHFVFRNICAVVTILVAIYFLYGFFGIAMQVHDQNQFIDNMIDTNISGIMDEAIAEVMLEDYGLKIPLFDISGIFSGILVLICVVACVLSNISNRHIVKPFCRTSVIATAVVIVVQIIFGTPLKYYVPAFVNVVIQGTDSGLKSVENMNRFAPQSLIYIATIAIVLSIAFIPAGIARRKNRSFVLFYVFGLFLFIPALIVSVCIGDKYDDQKLSNRGILVVIGLFITFYLTKVFITYIDVFATKWAEALYPQIMKSEGITGMLLAVVALEVVISFTLALIVALIITFLLKRPVSAIVALVKGSNNKTDNVDYNGKNAVYVCQLSRALPIAKKYETLFNRRDRLAKYEKLDIDKVMAISLPITIIGAILVQFVYKNAGMYFTFPWEQNVFPWRVYGIVILGIFSVSCILAKPIATLKVKKANKLDVLCEQKGYLKAIRNELPDFCELQDEDIRYKTLRNMRIIFCHGADRMTIADARNFALFAKEGIAMAKIIAIAAIPVVGAKTTGNYADNFADK